jgi:DNA-directed RNA polymerase specialized sigma24 family protein
MVSVRESAFERIATDYVKLRQRLSTFFGVRGCPVDELVGETMFRLTVRAAQGTVIDDVFKYALGIARYVYADWVAGKTSEDRLLQPLDTSVEAELPDTVGGAMTSAAECLQRCLADLGPEQRELLETFYLDDEQEVARLMERLGTSRNALRLRVFRVKQRLRACLRRCAAAKRHGLISD